MRAVRALQGIRASAESLPAPTQPVLRLRQGTIQTYVHEVLAESGVALRPKEVQLKVDKKAERKVSYESVFWCLRKEALDPSSTISRVGRGRYRASPHEAAGETVS
jgi:hypothetical protein